MKTREVSFSSGKRQPANTGGYPECQVHLGWTACDKWPVPVLVLEGSWSFTLRSCTSRGIATWLSERVRLPSVSAIPWAGHLSREAQYFLNDTDAFFVFCFVGAFLGRQEVLFLIPSPTVPLSHPISSGQTSRVYQGRQDPYGGLHGLTARSA